MNFDKFQVDTITKFEILKVPSQVALEDQNHKFEHFQHNYTCFESGG